MSKEPRLSSKIFITGGSLPSNVNWVPTAPQFAYPELFIAAFESGYEVYSMLYDTIQKHDDGRITACVARLEFVNLELIKRIIADEHIIDRLIDVSNARLAIEPVDGMTKHDLKKLPIHFFRLNYLLSQKYQPLIDLLQEVADREPKITFDSSLPLIRQKKLPDVNLLEFMDPEDVLYLRKFNTKDQARRDIFEELMRERQIKFPVHPNTMLFSDKEIVANEPDLRSKTLPVIAIDMKGDDAILQIKNFYQEYGRTEGIVLKPSIGSSGNAINFLEAGISDEELDAKVAGVVQKIKDDIEALPKHFYTDDSVLVVQQRLAHLTKKEGFDDLLTGDVRFTLINGELFGAVIRYSSENVEKVLSFEVTKPLLGTEIFNPENIQRRIDQAQDEETASYYRNLLKAHEVVQDVAKFCRERGYFHIGVDILIGRDSKGQWTYCLTELQNVWPDCIPETRRANRDIGDKEHKDIAPIIMDLIKTGRYICPPHMSFHETSALHLSSKERGGQYV